MDSAFIERAVWAVMLYAGLSLVELYFLRFRSIRRLGLVLNVFLFFLAACVFLSKGLEKDFLWLSRGIQLGCFGLGAYAGIRLVDGLIFDTMIQRRKMKPVPGVLRDIFRWLMAASAFFLILRGVFPNLNLNFLAISSIVVGYILGNATQDTLGNLIAGVALSAEKPFSIGDWVMVGGHTGQVVEMNWRATCLHTKTNDYILIPNSTIAREPIVNYSRPTRVHAVSKTIGVSYSVPPNRVRRVILGALAGVPEALKDPVPSVWLSGYGDSSITYLTKFYVSDFERIEQVESHFMDLVWYHFKREGIEIPFPVRDVRLSHAPVPGREPPVLAPNANAAFLDEIDLFGALSAEERALLAANLREEIYARGEELVRQGDSADTFYVIKSGRARVAMLRAGQEVEIAQLGEGDSFGEMSLLTGDRRNATVTAEADTHVLALSHEVLGGLLKRNAALSEEFAAKLERRVHERQRMTETVVGETLVMEPAPTQADLLEKIRGFFGLMKK
jgi:small-conductance mechanosensitive channel/CRP-like cAMP-binding protein